MLCQAGDRLQGTHASQDSPKTVRTLDDGARRASGIATDGQRKLA